MLGIYFYFYDAFLSKIFQVETKDFVKLFRKTSLFLALGDNVEGKV